MVGITSTSFYPWFSGLVGDVFTPSYVPVNLLPFTSQMTFVQRIVNGLTLMTMKAFYKYSYEPKVSDFFFFFLIQLKNEFNKTVAPNFVLWEYLFMLLDYFPQAQQIVDKYLGKLNGTITESLSNVNAVIMNTNFAFGDARPMPPGIIEVGGCTYKTPKPLPEVIIKSIYNKLFYLNGYYKTRLTLTRMRSSKCL